MSGTFPTTPRPSKLRKNSYRPTLVSTPHSLRRQTRSRGPHRWGLKLMWELLEEADGKDIFGFLDGQEGQAGKFMVLVFGYETPRGTPTGATVNGAHAAAAQSVVMDGFGNGIVVFKRGDILTFASHKKVYAVTSDVTSDGSGNATVPLNCGLQQAIIDNEAVTFSNVQMQCSCINDNLPRDWEAPMVMSGAEIELIEDPIS